MLALRARVFILEQGPYLDPDGVDASSAHLFGRDATGALLAYLRVVDPGIKYAEPSIGRVVVSLDQRGSGLGHALVAGRRGALRRRLAGAAASASARRRIWSAFMPATASSPSANPISKTTSRTWRCGGQRNDKLRGHARGLQPGRAAGRCQPVHRQPRAARCAGLQPAGLRCSALCRAGRRARLGRDAAPCAPGQPPHAGSAHARPPGPGASTRSSSIPATTR